VLSTLNYEIYTLCLKNDTTQPPIIILTSCSKPVIFDANITERICHQMVVNLSTSPV